MSIPKAFLLAAIALAAGLVVPRPALAQRGRPGSFVKVLTIAPPTQVTSSVTPAAASGPLGRPGASPTTPPGGVVNN